MLEGIRIQTINPENRINFLDAVLSWLWSEFTLKKCMNKLRSGFGVGSFWHNRNYIIRAFNQYHALVVTNREGETIAYMTWSPYSNHKAVDVAIIEVKPCYRRHGIFTAMLDTLSRVHPEFVVLTASVLDESRVAFHGVGWRVVEARQQYPLFESPTGLTQFYKITTPVQQGSDRFPAGYALAVSVEDFYQVSRNKSRYQPTIKYYPLRMNDSGTLSKVIVAPYHSDGYFALYFQGRVLTEGKLKHVVEQPLPVQGKLMVLSELKLIDKKLLPNRDLVASRLDSSGRCAHGGGV